MGGLSTTLAQFSAQFGISLWLFIIVIVWSLIWKLLALWKAARKGHVVWFILLALINTIGILEILYFYIFSELDLKKRKKDSKKNIQKKKRK